MIRPKLFLRLLLITSVLLWAVNRCLAVDPPPQYILDSPIAVQNRYVQERSQEGERLRAKVAKHRFQEKINYHRAVAAGFERELAIQRELMFSQQGADGADEKAPGMEDPEVGGGGRLSGRFAGLAGMFFLFLLAYRFRDAIFSTLIEKGLARKRL